MSVKNVKAFFAKMEGDKELLAKVGALQKKVKENLAQATADLVKIASAAGFEFTADDYERARKHKPPKEAEVSGQEMMLGGCNSNWTCGRVSSI